MDRTSVTWEACSLREWLNGEFPSKAFSEGERAMIPGVTVSADKNPDYNTSPGNSTTDQVFLLSITEAEKYFSNDGARQCQGTAYCYAQGAYEAINGNCWWWLRSPGNNSNYAAYILDFGSIYANGYYVSFSYAVRPALWVDLGTDENSESVPESAQEIISVGDTYIFGSYEQDNNTANGKEDIEWLVLAKEGDRILVISKYALDCQKYNSTDTDVTWETCTLRKWMNGEFLNAAFSAQEQDMIPTVTVSADKNPDYNTSPGNSTTDQVFLLSITEAEKYYSNDSSRQCQGTAYCYAQGAYGSGYGICWWLLRSPGHNSDFAANVLFVGSVNYSGTNVSYGDNAVRPALWIDLGS